MATSRQGAATEPRCSYCGLLGWTVEKYGRITHKEGCPFRGVPWHQGDPGVEPDGTPPYAPAAAKARKLTVGVPAELLAAATPRPWRWREDTWSIVGPRNEQAIVGGPKGTLVFISPNIQLALRAVNEYETLLAVEEKLRAFVDLWRGVPVGPDSFGQALAAARAALARLEEVRGG